MQIDERAAPCGGFSAAEVRWVAAQLVLGLGALHSLGVVHRDVKPTNVLLRHDGYYALTDFGLSSAPGASGKAGTRGFWAPEVVRREPQGPAADFWSLGVTLACAAVGRHPFRPAAAATPAAPVDAAARAAARAAADAAMDEATLHLPLNGGALHPPRAAEDDAAEAAQLTSLLAALLDRDADARLGGAGGAAAVREHAFLDEKVEWELLEAQALPAPFVPDKALVYAKDDVPAFSAGGGADVVEGGHADDVEGDQGWEFVPDEAAWREELAEFIRRRGDHFMSC